MAAGWLASDILIAFLPGSRPQVLHERERERETKVGEALVVASAAA